MELKIGDSAPDFSLEDMDGKPVRLSDFHGKKIVLYFYPKDDTPGCTKEACNFRDDLSKFKAKGAIVLGVSPDDAKSHRKFAEKYSLQFLLLSDVDKKAAAAYDVWREKSMYGKKYMGILRSTFVIDEKGKILAAIYGVKDIDSHSREILATL